MPATLTDIIRSEIAACGPMPFRRFMELALYHGEHGYYASGRASIGRGGDFFTNVSVGPLFGRLLARQIAEMWRVLGAPAEFTVIEQGAASGDLVADVLGGLRTMFPECCEAARFWIVEPFAKLEARQRERLADFAEKVKWARELATIHADACVHFSNELPDAFPVHLVKWTGGEWRERAVVEQEGCFVFAERPLEPGGLHEACACIPGPLPEGYTTEVNLAAAAWMREVAATMRRGFVLAVDYGFPRHEYYAPTRTAGTLSAYANHRREADPLARPGEIDLTAHVEFDSLIESAMSAGLQLEGFTDQHHFMVGLGMEHFADGANATERRAFQTLMHPQFMGAAFKVAAFSKGAEPAGPLAGFRFARAPRTP
ncbi:MAG: SAM-dependent methyltransferase [Chthoniobacteraceae bacterium]